GDQARLYLSSLKEEDPPPWCLCGAPVPSAAEARATAREKAREAPGGPSRWAEGLELRWPLAPSPFEFMPRRPGSPTDKSPLLQTLHPTLPPGQPNHRKEGNAWRRTICGSILGHPGTFEVHFASNYCPPPFRPQFSRYRPVDILSLLKCPRPCGRHC